MSRRAKVFLVIGIIVVALIALFNGARIWLDVLWFDSLSYLAVFTTILFTKLGLWFVFFALFLLFAGLNLLIAFRKGGIQKLTIPRSSRPQPGMPIELTQSAPIEINRKVAVWIAGIAVVVFGMILAGTASSRWELLQKFLHRTAFNVTDPLFQRDLSFYVFVLPFYNFLKGWSLGAVILTTAIVALIYLTAGSISAADRRVKVSTRATRHLLFLALLISILVAWHYWLKEYYLLLSPRGIIFGATYKDVKVLRLAYYVMIAIALFIAALIGIGASRRRFRSVLIGYAVLIGAAILITGIVPGIVQQFSVIPNQLQRELPYIKHNIDFTRAGYNLQNIEVQPFPVADSLSAGDFAPGTGTTRHIRIWDERPLKTTYKQLQEFRLYYDFSQVSVDRYHFGSDFRQVMLSARELNYGQLPQTAKTWVNQRLQYTHGYGLVMSPVNEKGPEGLPLFFIQDIPPKVSVPLTIDRPEIYYGQGTTEYVVSNTKLEEFDYPSGSANVFTNYKGSGGIPVKGFGRKLLIALRLKDWQILFTNYLKPDSRLMIYRSIQARVPKIAPFLLFDPDSYLVVDDGRLFWMRDAYTTTNMYPYSTPTAAGYNYIRNSVKTVVDAYSGHVTFYVIDKQDPLIRTYREIFPELFKDISEMPEGLKAHIRYPYLMFTVQAGIYETYHMTDPEVFYNKEDMWATPKEIYGDTQTDMIPYYIINSFPELKNPEQYVLMFPFTPTNKNNMVSWVAAFCDPDNYGRMIEYQFPKEKLIFGPLQIESRIDQNSEISQLFTLWSQSGSQIIRGNLLVIPIKDSLIYVEPVYLVSANSQLPELKIIIVAYQDRLAYAPTLSEALGQVFGAAIGAGATPVAAGAPTSAAAVTGQAAAPRGAVLSPGNELGRLIDQALQDYNAATEALRGGDFATYGQRIMALKNVLEELEARSRAAGGAAGQ
jgi:uncharacterized membrane protein (UPF0182 family)